MWTLALLVGCREDDPAGPWSVPAFTVRTGVEIATVLDAEPRETLTLLDDAGAPLLGMIADDLGQAHFSYVPSTFTVIDSLDGGKTPMVDGSVLDPGDYEIVSDDDPRRRSGRFRVMAIDEAGPESLYASQPLRGVEYSAILGPMGDLEEGYQYLRMRDGTLLGAMVRFPDRALYGDGPWPTVIEYSGYSPSRPDQIEPGTQIANALGYATVAVNMRGTGCSGGVFDTFNRAQHADGYDIVEIVARQDWALHHQVGMVGLSYPGISQLYVASTAPPSLAAIVPSSVIADAWEMQWPGGIYNSGFTRSWVGQRESEAALGGSSWVEERIAAGDEVCADNARLGTQNIDFESFLRGLRFRPADADDRDLALLVGQIEAPTYLLGAWQDEQTGPLFGSLLDRFARSPQSRFEVYNGRHPDGYSPDRVYRWYEFLELYVAERVPRMNQFIRGLGAMEFAGEFGYESYTFPPDRFADLADDDHAAALARFEQEPAVRLLLEVGGADGPAGLPVPRAEASFARWPAPEAEPIAWFFDEGGALASRPPRTEGADAWRFDPEAATDTFFGPAGYELMVPLWDLDWRPFAAEDQVAYETAPFDAPVVLAGPGLARLWVRSPSEPDVQVQVTLTEIRADGNEVLVQLGWLDLGHRAATEEDALRLHRTYGTDDWQAVPVGEWIEADVELSSFAHPFRAGSRLRVAVSTPGRNHGTWEFEPPAYAGRPSFHLGRGGARASSLALTTLPGLEVPEALPPCPSLRGQPCRPAAPVANTAVE
jgi:predicted acyl esterase